MRIEQLLKWLRDTPKDEAERCCQEIGTSVGYLRQIAYGHKRASENGADIERITGVSRRYLRPHDWRRIWPEMELLERQRSPGLQHSAQSCPAGGRDVLT